ncbi:hypothetical protein [Companilactobacillus zhachilii]|uniref:hypothetical protein n=1 Tax=Companilactobacillus zhachilii TaxID=2304606 RepID=UPI0040332464
MDKNWTRRNLIILKVIGNKIEHNVHNLIYLGILSLVTLSAILIANYFYFNGNTISQLAVIVTALGILFIALINLIYLSLNNQIETIHSIPTLWIFLNIFLIIKYPLDNPDEISNQYLFIFLSFVLANYMIFSIFISFYLIDEIKNINNRKITKVNSLKKFIVTHPTASLALLGVIIESVSNIVGIILQAFLK